MTRTQQEKHKQDIKRIILEELEFTNGWRISDEQYESICAKASKRIIHMLKRRKLFKF